MMSRDIEMPAKLPLVIVSFTYILTILILSFYTWVLWWIASLRASCNCVSVGGGPWHIYFLATSIILSIGLFIARMFYQFHIFVHLLSIILFFTIIGVAKMFVNKTRREGCKCTGTYTSKVVDITLYINVFVAVAIISIFAFWTMSGRLKI